MMKMKKISLCAAAVILYCVSGAYAIDYKTVNERGEELAGSVEFLGQQVIANNKPAFQAKLTKADRTYNTNSGSVVSNYTLNRVWAKDSTIVSGCATKNKKYEVEHVITADSKFFFSGGIHVGDNLSALEEFLEAPIQEVIEACQFEDSGWELNESASGGNITWDSAPEDADSLVIYYDSGRNITLIEYFTNKSYMPVSSKTKSFIEDQLRKMGI